MIANFLKTLEIHGTGERRKSRSEALLTTREIDEMLPDPPTDQKVVGSNPAECTIVMPPSIVRDQTFVLWFESLRES